MIWSMLVVYVIVKYYVDSKIAYLSKHAGAREGILFFGPMIAILLMECDHLWELNYIHRGKAFNTKD